MIEYSIRIKDEKDTLIAKDTVNGSLHLSLDNPFLKERINEALVKFGFDPNLEGPEIVLKFKMVWQN